MPAVVAELDSVSRLYGRFPVLRGVSAAFEAGRCYLLLGENGAGKSTLLRILAGLLAPTAGTVRIVPTENDAGSLDRASVEEQTGQSSRIGYMGHQPMLYEELSALENLRYFHSLYRDNPCLSPEETLQSVGLDPALRRPVSQYSQGMRQRASLARVLLPQPRLLLLDEPFSNLDAGGIAQMFALLRRQRSAQRAILLTTHQREAASPLADVFLTLEAGRLVSVRQAQ